MIVKARLRRDQVITLSTGWYAESFARTKHMKSLDDCIKPPETFEEMRARQAEEVGRAFRKRMMAEKE